MNLPDRIQQITPYQPIEPFEVVSQKLGFTVDQIIKLDANENPYGPSPKARKALAELAYPHIYPDPESRALRNALAEFTGVRAERLIAGSGADELIDLILRAVLEPNEQVMICPPTFGMYRFDALINNGRVLEVPRINGFELDVEEICRLGAAGQAKILFLTQPNNPDGGMFDGEAFERILALPLLVVVDEAYIEFSREGGRLGERMSRIREVENRENLVVLRTFSKWAGLAGLRVGYGAFPEGLVDALWRIKQPYNVNVAGTQAALASLQDLDWLSEKVACIKAERERLLAGLAKVPYLQPFPSQSNFILCRVKERGAAELKAALAARGILVRYYTSAGLADCIRVSVGRPADSERLLAALEAMI
jgi:histidinol-phosphate aminotransferase